MKLNEYMRIDSGANKYIQIDWKKVIRRQSKEETERNAGKMDRVKGINIASNCSICL